MSLPIGARLGPYEVVAPLGSGGMGEVYKARDTRLDRLVAIKILRSDVTISNESRERFEREAKEVESPLIAAASDEAPTRAGPLTAKGSWIGTAPYMAPEQLLARPADARTDVFAFGAVLHEIVTGRRASPPSSRSRRSWVGAQTAGDRGKVVGLLQSRAGSL